MIKVVVDEDMHRSVVEPLKKLGYKVLDIRDDGLRGSTDQEIYQFAQKSNATLISGDKDFSNIARFPLGEHYGIIIIRFPSQLSTESINEEIFEALKGVSTDDLKGNLVIVTPGKVRIRSEAE